MSKEKKAGSINVEDAKNTILANLAAKGPQTYHTLEAYAYQEGAEHATLKANRAIMDDAIQSLFESGDIQICVVGNVGGFQLANDK